MPDLSQAVIGFVASAAGALVAGYAGVWFGLAKLRRERAFEKRPEWYVKMVNVMQELVSKTFMLEYIPEPGIRQRLAEELTAAVITFNQLCSESRLYVSETADSALSDVLAALDELTPLMSSGDAAKRQEAKDKSVALLRYGVHILSNDVRSEFGLKRLQPPTRATVPKPPKPEIRT